MPGDSEAQAPGGALHRLVRRAGRGEQAVVAASLGPDGGAGDEGRAQALPPVPGEHPGELLVHGGRVVAGAPHLAQPHPLPTNQGDGGPFGQGLFGLHVAAAKGLPGGRGVTQAPGGARLHRGVEAVVALEPVGVGVAQGRQALHPARQGETARVEGVEVEVEFVLGFDLAKAPGKGERQPVRLGQLGRGVELGGPVCGGGLPGGVEQRGADALPACRVRHHDPEAPPPGHGDVGVGLGPGEADPLPGGRSEEGEDGPARRCVGRVGGALPLQAPGLLGLGPLEEGHPPPVGRLAPVEGHDLHDDTLPGRN